MAQRRARTADRDAAVETINDAYAEGQLSDTEHNARLTKALRARTLLQLERLTLDLQQAPASPTPPSPKAKPPSLREQFRQNAEDERTQWRHVPRWQKILIGAIFAGCIGGLGAIAIFDDGPDDRNSSITAGAGVPALTEKGLGAFIKTYQAEFDTSEVVSATFSKDDVALKVPTADGKPRHEEWRYRGAKFEKVADARRNADSQGQIDLAAIDLSALEDNIAEARTTLNVEKPDQILVWVERAVVGDRGPSVRIQVGNQFQEIGMLVTDLSGQTVIDRAPFSPSAG